MDTKTTKRQAPRRNPVKKAVALLGGQTATAQIFGISPQAVHKWCKFGFVPNGERCRTIETLLGGRVTRYALNPKMFGKSPTSK